MKKTLFFIFLFLHLGTLYSLESKVEISLGVLGFNFDYNKKNPDNMYFYGRIGSINYKSWFGLGASFSPIVFHYNYNDDNTSLTFANLSVNYNFLYSISNNFILGPFASINAVKYTKPDFYEFCSGIVLSWQNAGLPVFYKNSIFSPELLHLEAGCKYNKNENFVFTTTVSFDLLTMLYIIGSLGSSGVDLESSNLQVLKW